MEDSPATPPSDKRFVARRLEAVRKSLNLTKAEFADVIGIDRSSYTKIEKGVKPILPDAAYRIFELYGIDMNFIYLGQVGGLPARLSSSVISHLNGRHS